VVLLLLIPVVISSSAAAGYVIVRAAAGAAYGQDLAVAAAVSMIATEAAASLLLGVRRSEQATVVQVGLAATVMHMILTLALALAVRVLGFAPQHIPFLFWLLAFYWISLLILVRAVIAAIRRAAPIGAR
jgi:hypothetical protein